MRKLEYINEKSIIKFLKYAFRWQLSTPILYLVLALIPIDNELILTIVANGLGSILFFSLDSLIFKTKYPNPLWEIKDDITCADCGKVCKGYRLVKTDKYDRLNDLSPEFRCKSCSEQKSEELRKRGFL